MPRETLSKRGVRNTKLTILIPAEVMEDLKALRLSTCQSTGDLINRLIESELSKESAYVKEGRVLLAQEKERQERAKRKADSRRGERSRPKPTIPTPAPETEGDPEPKAPAVLEDPSETVKAADPEPTAEGEPKPLFTEDDIRAWSMESGSVTTQRKRRSIGIEFLEWLRAEGRSGTKQDAEDYAPLLRARYTNEATARNVVAVPRGLVKWWASR